MYNEQSSSRPTIPNDTVTPVRIAVEGIKFSKKTGCEMADCKAVVIAGPHKGMKISFYLGNPQHPNIGAWKEGSIRDISTLLEGAGVFVAGNSESYAQAAEWSFQTIMGKIQNTAQVAKIKLTPPKDGNAARNEIGEFGTPNPSSSRHAIWKAAKEAAAGGAPATAPAPSDMFAAPVSNASSFSNTPVSNTPSFLG